MSFKGINANEYIANLIEKKRKESLECIEHVMYDRTFLRGYRLYRRGKNRCLRCGLKLK